MWFLSTQQPVVSGPAMLAYDLHGSLFHLSTCLPFPYSSSHTHSIPSTTTCHTSKLLPSLPPYLHSFPASLLPSLFESCREAIARMAEISGRLSQAKKRKVSHFPLSPTSPLPPSISLSPSHLPSPSSLPSYHYLLHLLISGTQATEQTVRR